MEASGFSETPVATLNAGNHSQYYIILLSKIIFILISVDIHSTYH
jgi:hypothetical protein